MNRNEILIQIEDLMLMFVQENIIGKKLNTNLKIIGKWLLIFMILTLNIHPCYKATLI
jgi:hypothetical protein